jgi:Ser-tRNA(Ala) deacylase AlaX
MATAAVSRLATRLLFLEDTYLFKFSKTNVLSVLTPTLAGLPDGSSTENKRVVLLSETIFHPQGGGQPFDKGVIIGKTIKFLVSEVRQKGDEVQHIGTFETPEDNFVEGEEVDLEIDEEARRLNARLHSAGHLLDIALRNIGQTQLVPGKGYHFPDAPYVEYEGNIDQKEREVVRKRLEQGQLSSHAFSSFLQTSHLF